MIFQQVETFLANICFIALFMLMLVYWVQASFNFSKNFSRIGLLSTVFVNFLLLIVLGLRWIHYGHFPLSNLYESLIFLSWSLTLLQFILEKMSKSFFLGVVISPMALFINSFATFSLPKDMQKANVLVPALQSNWLMMHVTIMMLSYAALICGSLLAITFLIITYRTNLNLENTKKTFSILFLNHHKWSDHTTISDGDRVLAPSPSKQSVDGTVTSWNQKENSIQLQNSKIFSSYGLIQDSQKKSTKVFLSPQSYSLGSPSEQLEPSKSGSQKLYPTQEESKLAKTIDNLSYRTLGIGFPLLTIGILSGSVWANEAWGSYWSWDPKETWAFITWLIFAIYLHTRITKGWQGEKPAIIASFGFLIVWICYLGVNLLGKGLHSYGWIQ